MLDPIIPTAAMKGFEFILARLNLAVTEAEFFTGDLRTSEGEAIWLAAKITSIPVAIESARRTIARSKRLQNIEKRWGDGPILKIVSASLQNSAHALLLRTLTVDALRRKAHAPETFFIVNQRAGIDLTLVNIPGIRIRACAPFFGWLMLKNRFIIAVIGCFRWMRDFGRTLRDQDNKNVAKYRDEVLRSPIATVLTQEEDELSDDRSYRTQPHWLFKELGMPSFRTIILKNSKTPLEETTAAALAQIRTCCVRNEHIRLLSNRTGLPSKIASDFRSSRRKVFTGIFSPRGAEINALAVIATTMHQAKCLAKFCRAFHVRVFLASENYMLNANAMMLVGPKLGIKTISFQYAFRVFPVVPAMLTTADVMVTFAPAFDWLWNTDKIHPLRFSSCGYLFDSSFHAVRERAKSIRQSLLDSGADFVICYFDESVQFDKYGLISQADHVKSLTSLLELVCSDNKIALICKSQFQRNTTKSFPELILLADRARASGRFIDLQSGVHRNTIFPAEAALASDITIGHAFAVTASLEAALTGSRSILIDAYGCRSSMLDFFRPLDIIFPSLQTSLQAINDFRSGNAERKSLGDWSSILHHFDQYHDGKAVNRLRAMIEQELGNAT